jgi:uncharacterized phage protein gp47/JayE
MASTFTVKTAEDIRDDILRTYRAGLIRIGVTNPNVTPGSDIYVLAQAIGDQLEVAMANAQVKADAMMPDTATATDLDRLLAVYALTRRVAAGSSGNVVMNSSAPSTVIAGTQLVDGAGLRFTVTTGGTYANGATVPVAATDVGAITNHSSGDTLKWSRSPPYSASTALVAAGGLTGGVNDEDDETARARLYGLLRNPPGTGNCTHIAQIAEASTTKVQKAFVYPALLGPGNFGVTVIGYPDPVTKSRAIDPTTVANLVAPYIIGRSPEHADALVTGSNDVSFDVSLALSLPASPRASTPGPGGGWTDGTSWPRNVNSTSTFRCLVTAVTSSTSFTVDAPSSPIAGVTQVCWLSPLTWTTYTAKVLTVSGSAGAYAVTLDAPFAGIAVGNAVSPNATNADAYFQDVLAFFAGMGPGEQASLTTGSRYFRHPTPAQSWPNTVNALLLRQLTTDHTDVQSAQFLFRTSTAPPSGNGAGYNPGIYIPGNIAFYEAL